jgi:hypothetical protein
LKSLPNPFKEILLELEMALWEHDERVEQGVAPYEYDDETFRACTKVFMSAMMWKLYAEQNRLNLPIDKREAEAYNVGVELKTLIKNWTHINTEDLYK